MKKIHFIFVLFLFVISLDAQISPMISIDKWVDNPVGLQDTAESVTLEVADSINLREDDSSNKKTMFLLRESDILVRLNSLPIYTWSDDMRYIQPLAQDFSRLFDNSKDEEKISVENAIGVSLAGIKAISQDLKHYDLIIIDLQKENEDLRRKTRLLERNMDKQRKEIEMLKRQMADLASRLGR